ncbi:MAG: elongation factor G [Acidobacteria bacterium]|nr:elongation factor G [Acidobacteriota bacterium]
MKTFSIGRIRNIALVGHGGSGKTSLAEALLFLSGAINRIGSVTEGTTTSDFDPEETRRQISISLALAPLEWKEHKINLLDAPGYGDFVADAEAALRAADAAVIVVSAVEGVEVQARAMWEEAERLGLPRVIVINKLDRERASFERTLQQLVDAFGPRVSPLHLPIGEEHAFEGAIDLLAGKAVRYSPTRSEAPIPDALAAQAASLRERLVESVVESDEALMERYLEGGEIDPKEIIAALGKAVSSGTTVPVLCTAATKGIGADLLADLIVDAAPSPADRPPVPATRGGTQIDLAADPAGPLGAAVFKTLSDPYVGRITFFRVFSGTLRPDASLLNSTRGEEERVGQIFTMRGKHQESVSEVPAGDIGAVAKLAHTVTGDTLTTKTDAVLFPSVAPPEPIFALAIAPKTKGDEDKLSTALQKIAAEDPSFRWERNSETHQTLIKGMGDVHLEVVVERLHRHHVEVETFTPRIPYRETVRKSGSATGRHVKQSGGRGQYAVATVEISPLPRGSGFEYQDGIVGGAVPNQFIPSVEKGIRKALEEGVLAGYQVVDFKARLFDGKFHSVDSSDIAFQLAGALAFREAAREAGVVLLEPIMDLEVLVPDESTGDIMGDLSSKRARIEGTEGVGRGWNQIRAKVPQAELLRYAIDLRSKTGGRGTFRVSFSHYEEAPSHVTEKVVAEARKAKEEEHAKK